MIEQAAADRVLFLNEASQAVRHVDLRFPEYVCTTLRGGKEKVYGGLGANTQLGCCGLQSYEEKK